MLVNAHVSLLLGVVNAAQSALNRHRETSCVLYPEAHEHKRVHSCFNVRIRFCLTEQLMAAPTQGSCAVFGTLDLPGVKWTTV